MMTRRLMLGLAAASAGCARVGAMPVPRIKRDHVPVTELTDEEIQLLDRGELVAHRTSFRHDLGKYIGATCFIIAQLEPQRVMDEIYKIENIPMWMPFNHKAEIVDGTGDDLVVEMRQGVNPFFATFSLRVQRRDPVIRWELDESRPNDIDDLWGFFTARPFGRRRSLLTTGIAVDLGTGVLRLLEKEISRVIPDATRDARAHLHGYIDYIQPSFCRRLREAGEPRER